METSNFHVVSLLLTWFKLNFHHSMEAFYYVRMYLLAMTAATALSLSRYAPPPPPRLHVRSEQESQIPKIAIYIHSLLSPASTLGVCLSVCWRMSRTRQLRGYSQRRWRISMDTKIATSSWGRRLAWQLTEQEGLPSATSSPRKPQQTQDSRAGSLWRLGDLGDTQRCTRSSLRGQKGCSTLPYTTIGGDWMGKMGRNMGWGIGSTESESEGGSGWGLDSLGAVEGPPKTTGWVRWIRGIWVELVKIGRRWRRTLARQPGPSASGWRWLDRKKRMLTEDGVVDFMYWPFSFCFVQYCNQIGLWPVRISTCPSWTVRGGSAEGFTLCTVLNWWCYWPYDTSYLNNGTLISRMRFWILRNLNPPESFGNLIRSFLRWPASVGKRARYLFVLFFLTDGTFDFHSPKNL